MSENILPSPSSLSLSPPPTHGAPPPPPPPRVRVPPTIPVAPQPPPCYKTWAPPFGKSNMSEKMNIQSPKELSNLDTFSPNASPQNVAAIDARKNKFNMSLQSPPTPPPPPPSRGAPCTCTRRGGPPHPPRPPPRPFGAGPPPMSKSNIRPPGSKLERLGANAPPRVPEKEKTLILKPKKIHLIDLRKAINTEIMLTSVKLLPTDIVNAVLVMDNTRLDFDQVENILKFCPTKEEMEQLKNYTGDTENLGKCEQYFLELMKVPRIETKLTIFLFKFQFHTQLANLKKSLNIVNSACEEIKHCVRLKEVMKRILYLGNTLNQGTAKGGAAGFKLDSLLKLTDTRSTTKYRMTLMHYLCKLLVNKSPHLLDFPKDLENLEPATKIQLSSVKEEMLALSVGLRKAKQELHVCANDGNISEGFHTILKGFINHTEVEGESVQKFYDVVAKSADGLALYFGEDPKRCPFEQAIQTFSNFVRLFVKSHKENIKYAELEREESREGDGNDVVLPATGCSSNPSLISV